MFIGLRDIELLFEDYPHYMTKTDNFHCLMNWQSLSLAPLPYSPHSLYVCSLKELSDEICSIDNLHLLCLVSQPSDMKVIKDKTTNTTELLAIACDNATSILLTLQNYFNRQSGICYFAHTLFDFLDTDHGLQNTIENIMRLFNNPICVFDGNMNLVASSFDEMSSNLSRDLPFVKKSNSLKDLHKPLSLNDYILKEVQQSEVPFQTYNESLGYDQVYCAIDTKKNIGYIVLSAVNRPIQDLDFEALVLLKKYIKQQFNKDEFMHESRGFNYEYFMRDILEGTISSGTIAMKNYSPTIKEFSGNMCLLMIDSARGSKTINAPRVRTMLENYFPSAKTILFHGQVVSIIMLSGAETIPENYLSTLEKLIRSLGLFAGISLSFKDIFDLPEYYQQALRALEYGFVETSKPGLFQYSTYYLSHVKEILGQDIKPDVFCHPKMRVLMAHDKEYNDELAYTLYMYLLYERNYVKVGDAMNLHRTSIAYRIKKIENLINIDYENADERMYLILSYEMNKSL